MNASGGDTPGIPNAGYAIYPVKFNEIRTTTSNPYIELAGMPGYSISNYVYLQIRGDGYLSYSNYLQGESCPFLRVFR